VQPAGVHVYCKPGGLVLWRLTTKPDGLPTAPAALCACPLNRHLWPVQSSAHTPLPSHICITHAQAAQNTVTAAVEPRTQHLMRQAPHGRFACQATTPILQACLQASQACSSSLA
jgi:hypothetical protein